MNKVKKKKLLEMSISIEIHLGKNPKNGGNPPNERRGKLMNSFWILFFIFKENIWLIWKILKFLNIKIIINDNKE